jgi:MFS family permease
VAGLVVFAVFAGAAIAQTVTSRLRLGARQVAGLVAMAAGLVTLVIGMVLTDFPTFLVGGVLAGVGAGMLFKAAVGSVAGMAAPEKRGGALAGLFLVSYVGLSLPAVGIGLVSLLVTPTVAMTGLTVVLLIVLVVVGVLARRGARA